MTQHEPDPPSFDEPEPEPATALGETTNVAEPTEVRKRLRQQAQKAKTGAEFWQAIFATPEGRREAWVILSEAGTFEQRSGISANGGYEPILSAFHAGQKAMGQHLFDRWLGYDQAGVLLMLTENHAPAKPIPTRRGKTPT